MKNAGCLSMFKNENARTVRHLMNLFDYLMDNINEEEVTYKEWKASKEISTHLVSTTQHVTEFNSKLIDLL
jgi:hypothetical protein